MSMSLHRFSRFAVAPALALALGLPLSGCAHTPCICSSTTQQDTAESQAQKKGPPFQNYHHLGHSHFKRNSPKTNGGQ